MQTVYGLLPDRNRADAFYDILISRGFSPTNISVMAQSGSTPQTTMQTSHDVASSVAEGATAGATIGGLAGIIAGLTAITIPGIGAVFIAGPIAAAFGLGGAAATTVSGTVTGALAGGLLGSLAGLGLPQNTAQIYVDELQTGRVLIGVRCEEGIQANEVQRLFLDHQATGLHILPSASAT